MNYSSRNLERIAKNITVKVSDELDRVGIFYRIYYRCKQDDSVKRKMILKTYDGEKNYLRDIIGIRINLYFADDIDIVYPYFKQLFEFVEETIDVNEETIFKPTRINIIFRVPNENQKEFRDIIADGRIDNTFELQFRTVLSEGWHEVDHDLRYKCKSDWENNQDLGRMFNGVFASLEASDWAIIQIFQKLSYRHYKKNYIDSLIRSKFRIRLRQGVLDPAIKDIVSSDNDLRRLIFKIDRQKFLSKFLDSNVIIPISLNSLILLLNYLFINNIKLNLITPPQLLKEFQTTSNKKKLR